MFPGMIEIKFATHPEQYKHWKLSFDGATAHLGLDISEDGGLRPGYSLKLNSYDLSVDIELADALNRIRFEHPEVKVLVIRSLKDRIFCSGANIYMLGLSEHGFKVNFCKFTNETRLGLEDASENSGIKSIAAVNGVCAGGGYELALACDEILLVDDGNSAVSLPEVPLLGVLPGTGGLTRVVDKRHVRRDHADVFSTIAEGIRGKRAVEWDLVDHLAPRSRFDEEVKTRAATLAEQSDRPSDGKGVSWVELPCEKEADRIAYRHARLSIDRNKRLAEIVLKGPEGDLPASANAIVEAGCDFWLLRAFRELDELLLHLRFNEAEIGTLLIKTEGQGARLLEVDRLMQDNADHWLVREILNFVGRTLKRLDMMARSTYAVIEPGSCFAGTFLELALSCDRAYALDDPDQENPIQLSPMNLGRYKMGNGLSRIRTRFWGNDDKAAAVEALTDALDPQAALAAGLITFAPDDIDWDDELRVAIEERASLSPDALTGLEANLRFPGPETLETKIFGRLTAWQNWIFQRPNAVGERGALKVYGNAGLRPEFDWRRT
jgi:benzoyl-CoA-dihydrodiol lyase